MASSSGASSGGTLRSSSLETLPDDQRKRKRMISNRESARRSRKKKQKHLDDLSSQLIQLVKEKDQILNSMNVTTQLYLNVEAENSVLRAQATELGHRLDALNEILIGCFDNSGDSGCGGGGGGGEDWFLWGSNNFNGNLAGLDVVMY